MTRTNAIAWNIEIVGGRLDGTIIVQWLLIGPMNYRFRMQKPTLPANATSIPLLQDISDAFDYYEVYEYTVTRDYPPGTGLTLCRAWAKEVVP